MNTVQLQTGIFAVADQIWQTADYSSIVGLLHTVSSMAQQYNPIALTNYTPEEFLTEQDFQQIKQALEWWPKDVPPEKTLLTAPLMSQLLSMYHSDFNKDNKRPIDIVLMRSHNVCLWLVEEKRDIRFPNETAAQRKARKNREAQKKHQEKVRDSNPELSAAWQIYKDVCEEKRVAMQHYTDLVSSSLNNYKRLKAQLISDQQSNG